MKIKIGDSVKYKGHSDRLVNGKIYIVSKIDRYGEHYGLEGVFVENYPTNFHYSNFTLVEPEFRMNDHIMAFSNGAWQEAYFVADVYSMEPSNPNRYLINHANGHMNISRCSEIKKFVDRTLHVTKQDIADKFNVNVNDLIIK